MAHEATASLPVPPASHALVLAKPASAVGMRDEEFAGELKTLLGVQQEAAVAANGYTARLFTRSTPDAAWHVVASGDFGTKCVEAAKPLIKRKLLRWMTTTQLPDVLASERDSPPLATLANVKAWHSRSQTLTGRGGEASPSTRAEVSALAAWRCQFEGCGKNLRKHVATGRSGVFSYYAHIVASSPDGPRGDNDLSAALADDPTNILLLCDECHRLIDRVDPETFTTHKLRQMRDVSIKEVDRLLSYLAHDPVDVMAIIGNVSGQRPHLYDRDVDQALWQSRLRSRPGGPLHFFDGGGLQHDPHSAAYWGAMFSALKLDIPRLRAMLYGTDKGGAPRPRLGVFPHHASSVLVLAGRIIGDTAGVFLFQPHRDSKSPSISRWAWTDAKPPLPRGSIFERERERHRAIVPNGEACLLVSLTFEIAPDRLPRHCFDGANFLLPTMEVATLQPSPGVVGHPNDLFQLGAVLDRALQHIQDIWKANRIHLFVGAPTTACFAIGQKLQARHHASVTCYEVTGGHGSGFSQTIEITSSSVRELVSGHLNSIDLK